MSVFNSIKCVFFVFVFPGNLKAAICLDTKILIQLEKNYLPFNIYCLMFNI